MDPRASLDAWRAEIDRCFGGIPQTAQGRNLQPFIDRFSLPRRPFEDLVDGVEMDLRNARYETFEALYEYLLARGVHGRADLRRDFRLYAAGVA